MKSFQLKDKVVSGGDDDPGDPPDTRVPITFSPDQPTAEPEPMTRPTRRNRNAEIVFRGERRSNATHASVTDPDARLFKKSPGAGAFLCFMGHSVMENRSGLIVPADLTQADGHAERRAAIDMLHRHSPGSTRRLTPAADRGYDGASFVAELRQMVVTPHVARKSRHFAIRRQNHPALRLRSIAAAPEEDRRTFRLGQNRRRHGAATVSWHRTGASPLHLGDGGRQSGEAAEAACRLRWTRATQANLSRKTPHRTRRTKEAVPPKGLFQQPVNACHTARPFCSVRDIVCREQCHLRGRHVPPHGGASRRTFHCVKRTHRPGRS